MLTILRAVGVCALHLALAVAASAQEGVPFGEGPRFMATVAGSAAPVEVEINSVPMLHRRISLAIEDELLKDALEKVGQVAGLEFVYSPSVINSTNRMSLRAENMTVAAVLTDLLVDAQVDVLLSGGRYLTLTPRESNALVAMTATIIGRVTESETGDPVVNAQVAIDGRGRAITDGDGQYRIEGVEAGRRTISVTSIGYARASREVEVGDGATLTIDFALDVSATPLDAVVVTVTGQQRARELGHVVGRINADSVVREAPVSTLSELLTARVPGLLVRNRSGQLGGTVNLQLRSRTSIDLETEPLMVVDGVRYRTGTTSGRGPFKNVETTSRMNDLNINDIESIEVVKGPSAAALYGTDAANGVIVVTTKRGRPGPAQWNAYVRAGYTETARQRYPDVWWGWGDATNNCSLAGVARGSCVQDSVTVVPNVLNDPEMTALASKPRWEYGANVSGGTEGFGYYFSVDLDEAIGPVQMPPALVQQLLDQRGISELPEEQRYPNKVEKSNLRGSFSADLGANANVRLNLGYTRNATRTMAFSPLTGAGLGTPDNPYYIAAYSPDQIFSQTTTEHVERFSGSISGEWRPLAWFETRATIGLDQSSTNRTSLVLAGDAPDINGSSEGRVGDDRGLYRNTTANLGATASFQFGSVSSRTSVGTQYARTLDDLLIAEGRGLPPGGTTIGMASTLITDQSYDESVVLGGYLEQVFGLNERLYVSGALRVDGGSGFGQDFTTAVYPKAGLSWIVSEEPFLPRIPGLDELRIRYAFGAAGQQALAQWTRPRLSYNSGIVLDGEVGSVDYYPILGNPDLRPERVREHELGLDLTVLEGRVELDLTWNWRRTVDGILIVPIAAGSVGSINRTWTNVGLITARGFEAAAHTRLLDTRAVSVDLGFSHAFNSDKVADLGDADPNPSVSGGAGYVEGYPLGGVFSQQILGYDDANGDGIIEAAEVELSDERVYAGRSTPPVTQTYSATLGIMNERFRITALLDRQTGFIVHRRPCFEQCRGAVDPSTPLAEQAELSAPNWGSQRAVLEPGDFARLREVSVLWELPQGLVRTVRADRASLNVSARNLALWTAYDGDDPESDTYTSGNSLAQSRAWTVRLDIGF